MYDPPPPHHHPFLFCLDRFTTSEHVAVAWSTHMALIWAPSVSLSLCKARKTPRVPPFSHPESMTAAFRISPLFTISSTWSVQYSKAWSLLISFFGSCTQHLLLNDFWLSGRQSAVKFCEAVVKFQSELSWFYHFISILFMLCSCFSLFLLSFFYCLSFDFIPNTCERWTVPIRLLVKLFFFFFLIHTKA